jgi:hypothetical protein
MSKAGKARSAKPPRPRSAKPRKSKPLTNGAGKVEAARHAVEETAKGAGSTLGNAASRAKVPLLAGGAALAGAAGGMAFGARQARRHRSGTTAVSRRPQVKLKSSDLARAAKEVGRFGAQMGHLASELQQTRESANGARRRSPVEVVLEGLTARRSSR